MERTLKNCTMIKMHGEPLQEDGKCLGFAKANDDEPCEICKRCKLNSWHEEVTQ